MKLYEESAPAIRVGELDVGGRRASGRLMPYAGDHDGPAIRFDPIDRFFSPPARDARVAVGPHDPARWRSPLARIPPGPVLIGPGSPAEEIRGTYRAAAAAAKEAGRAAYLLDPGPAGLPPGREGGFVVVCAWSGSSQALDDVAAAARSGLPSGLLLPAIPGWTDEPAFLEEILSEAAEAGARFVAAVAPRCDGDARRRIVEARGDVSGFFERIHHLDWERAMPATLAAVRAAVRDRGLAELPSRPWGAAEPAGNALAAARLEERAAAVSDDHRLALLHAAARWIDESGRDLRAVLAEGNFRKVFPFAPEIATEAEKALAEAP
ncbi:MAG: hypothetical protein ABR576_02380 [Thermoanaerobaculia bacterium]